MSKLFLESRSKSVNAKSDILESIVVDILKGPKLKPKKYKEAVRDFSPMDLNSKGLKDQKRNKNSIILLATNYYYLSCPELDEHDDSDSTSFTMGNSEKGDKASLKFKKASIKIKEPCFKDISALNELKDLNELNDVLKTNSYEYSGLGLDSTSINKTKKSILKKKTSDFKEDYEGLALELKRKPNSRLSLKFEEEKKHNYPLDTNSYTPCGLQRKKTEEMKIDSQIFSKYKKILSYSGTKVELSSPELESKKNKLNKIFNPSKLSFNAAIDEEEEFSLYPSKYQSCNLEAFNPSLGVRKSSSILSKLKQGITRKHTTPLFPVAKGNINEEENDDIDC